MHRSVTGATGSTDDLHSWSHSCAVARGSAVDSTPSTMEIAPQRSVRKIWAPMPDHVSIVAGIASMIGEQPPT